MMNSYIKWMLRGHSQRRGFAFDLYRQYPSGFSETLHCLNDALILVLLRLFIVAEDFVTFTNSLYWPRTGTSENRRACHET